ncbi:MAG: hypothetical protein ACYTEN_06470, partial [Planctomycetota bacterium]
VKDIIDIIIRTVIGQIAVIIIRQIRAAYSRILIQVVGGVTDHRAIIGTGTVVYAVIGIGRIGAGFYDFSKSGDAIDYRYRDDHTASS